MIRKGVDIRHQLHFARARSRTANPARERDHQTAVPALIRPDLQQFRPNHTVESGPVRHGMGVVQLTHHGRHQRNGVRLSMAERIDPGGEI